MLREHHRTKVGEEPNHEQVSHYFLGTGEYASDDFRIVDSQHAMLRAVVFERGPRGSTNLDRWLNYLGRYLKVIRKIPDRMLPIPKHHTQILRDAIKPAGFREKVKKCVKTWLDPITKEMEPRMQSAYNNVEDQQWVIERIAKYLDRQKEDGMWNDPWIGPNNRNRGGGPRRRRNGGGGANNNSGGGGANNNNNGGGANNGDGNKYQRVCKFWKAGNCKKGNKCNMKHVGAAGSGGSGNATPTGDPCRAGDSAHGPRCNYDKANLKCPKGDGCLFAHLNTAVNKFKKAKIQSPNHANKTCNCCGAKGHIIWNCKKLVKHENDLKKEIGYTGDKKWFMTPANSKKSKDLFSAKNWMQHAEAGAEVVAAAAAADEVLPFKLEAGWLDGGWCTLGFGEHEVRVRLMIDLGGTCTIGMEHMFRMLATKATKGLLGAARVASNVARLKGQTYAGTKKPFKNWIQMPIQAPNVRGTPTIVVGQYVSFVRSGDQDMLIAGKDLAYALGYLNPRKQRENAAETGNLDALGVDPEALLGKGAPKRKYALSNDTTRKIRENRERERRYTQVLAEGRIFLGEQMFDTVTSAVFVTEPLLRFSYCTTAVLAAA